ncbi:MAG: DEAD/DEAH box helicase [Gammaproteobacteria bacterium]|nr:DEAD/DEAH box helicase [Gammaproteobacteria bacterium]
MPLQSFHPAVAAWFAGRFAGATAVQAAAWPAIGAGGHALLAAPTGSGKTLAAFLAAIDSLVREAEQGPLPDEVRVVYVSPLKALSNDIRCNLEEPLAGIQERVLQPLGIRAAVRTGDTPPADRARMRRQPPHILVTTPESLYILLTSASGRDMLATARTLIVDELHALADNKRGAHLMLSLERLTALCASPPQRIGISATQKPIERMARFLVGDRADGCTVVDTGHVRRRDLAIELPGSALAPVMAAEVWAEIYDRLAELVRAHRSTLIFVNTRRLAERVARHLAERLDPAEVTAHHGSLAREHRLEAEQKLKTGRLRALVATASLELGIDIGDVDLCCQLGSPRAIATFLQRVGRSGHGVDALPKGRLFPLTRDDLVECAALLDAVRRDELDAIEPARPALDVLAQQLVAEVAAREWTVDGLYDLVRRAAPYRELGRQRFDEVVQMLADGFTTRRGRHSLHLHYDAVNGRLRPRPGARLTAITNGGAIPDQFDYDVVLLPEEIQVGTLNEDFAFESLPGDIFQLGNTSYRIARVETGRVLVEDARGQPPNIPFWFGEAPGRSDELSLAVSRLRDEVSASLELGEEATRLRLERDLGLAPMASSQLVEYLGTARLALGELPTHETIILERFFDEVGDCHLVIHSPYGSRINRAWGLALRKRFCRKFNYELQAAALEDSIVISLGPVHSFPLAEIAGWLKAETVRNVLVQALLAAPMFPTRWRWAATTALALRRFRNGRKVPPQFQRSDAEDLLAVVFPDQIACAENIVGDRQVPDHPLVRQTLDDCLHELMDVEGLERLLARIAAGEVRIEARDVTTPSPLAQEILTARPYAFLDDAPAEERRTLAVRSRHLLDPLEAASIARLDPTAIALVCQEAWPEPRSADELHDALVLTGFLAEEEAGTEPEASATDWLPMFQSLVHERRATVAVTSAGRRLWVAAERLAQLLEVLPDVALVPRIDAVRSGARGAVHSRSDALRELLRGRLETLGPVTASELARPLGLADSEITVALLALEAEGAVMQGRYRAVTAEEEWCDRRLLARIHRLTLSRLREQVEPVTPAHLMQFLFAWHGMGAEKSEGPEAARRALARLRAFPAPAAAWEGSLLPARVEHYSAGDLDTVLASGQYTWSRAGAEPGSGGRRAGPIRATPVVFVDRAEADAWSAVFAPPAGGEPPLGSAARAVRHALAARGAMFFVEIVRATGQLRTQVEQGLAELVAWGFATSDHYTGLRSLITPASRRASFGRALRPGALSVDAAGRWSLVMPAPLPADTGAIESGDPVEVAARALLDRYGVVFRAILRREAWYLPPWRDLARVLRRLEARGEIRGGRFVSGFTGEQFALPQAVEGLRAARRQATEAVVVTAAADPLNLCGIVTPGARVPAAPRNRVLWRGGVPVGVCVAGDVTWLVAPDPSAEWGLRNLLLRSDRDRFYVPGGQRSH